MATKLMSASAAARATELVTDIDADLGKYKVCRKRLKEGQEFFQSREADVLAELTTVRQQIRDHELTRLKDRERELCKEYDTLSLTKQPRLSRLQRDVRRSLPEKLLADIQRLRWNLTKRDMQICSLPDVAREYVGRDEKRLAAEGSRQQAEWDERGAALKVLRRVRHELDNVPDAADPEARLKELAHQAAEVELRILGVKP